VVKEAVDEGLADPKVVAADTTAQEASVPYPNEMGLMATFMTAVSAASTKVGTALRGFLQKAAGFFERAKRKVREYRLFAKMRTKEAKDRMVATMASVVEAVQRRLEQAMVAAEAQKERLARHSRVAWAKLARLSGTMKRLLPQIRYWLKTGRVAANKIISLHIPELYSVVRGKVGKAVEFGRNWGITRLRGGFLLATVAKDRRELVDNRFAIQAVHDHARLFGRVPVRYAYDRAGYSAENVETLRGLGVRQVGLAPLGRAQWAVSDRVRNQLVKERAKVEGGIGTIKSTRYGFNRPAARSAEMMGVCGQRAVLGFNLNKLVRELAAREGFALVG
jgi:hypothetical protein